MKISVGDMVTLKPGRVTRVDGSAIDLLWGSGPSCPAFMGTVAADTCIASVESRPLQEGDLCKRGFSPHVYKIERIVNGVAAVSVDGVLRRRNYEIGLFTRVEEAK